MADNSVYISGIADGAFRGLDQWATEKTAEKILASLEKLYKFQSEKMLAILKASGGSSTPLENTKEFKDELAKLTADLEKENKENEKYNRELEDARKKEKKYWDWRDAAYDTARSVMVKFSESVIEVMKANYVTYSELSTGGINLMANMGNVSDGFQSLSDITEETGIRYQNLSKALLSHTVAINAFSVGDFAKVLTSTEKSLTNFNYTSKESADLLGVYLDMQLGYADSFNRNMTSVGTDVISFGKEINQLSLATGNDRKQLLDHIDALSQTTQASIMQAQVGDTATQNMIAFAASIKNQGFAQALLDMQTNAIKPLNNTFMALQQTGLGGFGQELMNFSNSIKGMDPTQARKATAEFYENIKNRYPEMINHLNLFSQLGGQVGASASQALNILAGLKQTANAYQDAAQKDPAMAARSRLSSQWERFLSTMQGLFAPTAGMLNMATSVLRVFNNTITDISKEIDKIFGPNGKVVMSWAALGLALAVMTSRIKLFDSALDIFGFGKKAEKSVAGSLAAEGAKGIEGGAEKELEKVSKSRLGNLGESLGTGIKAVLTGLANGLKELAQPKVFEGIGALALLAGDLWLTGEAIKAFVGLDWDTVAKAGVVLVGLGVIGAGLGAAAELIVPGALALAALGAALGVVGDAMGTVASSLPTLSEGLRSISNINGKGLLDVSLGIGALAGAMTVLAASSVISTAGNMLANIGTGLTHFFGGKSLLDKIKEMANIGPHLALAGSGITEVASGLAELNDSLKNLTNADRLEKIVSIINQLDLGKVTALASITGNTTKSGAVSGIKNTPTNSSITNALIQSVPKEPLLPLGSGVEKPPVDSSVTDLITYQSTILEQLLNSTNSLVSVNKDILKYTKVHS